MSKAWQWIQAFQIVDERRFHGEQANWMTAVVLPQKK